ncbi:AAA family ATPase [Vibrio splendidus]
MNFIDSVKVEGFWGERTLEFNFHDDINFIIGINGSGKTTAINIIVAALTADFSELDSLEFSKITIKLKSFRSRKKPSVTIIKKDNNKTPFSTIEYEIKESASDKAVKLSLDDFEEQLMIRRYPRHIVDREVFKRHGVGITKVLDRLVNVSWLSVNRSNTKLDEYGNEKDISTVDRKLKELSNRLVRYFSTLGKAGSEQIESFQKEVFCQCCLENQVRHSFQQQNLLI